jgi:hypothetical protein
MKNKICLKNSMEKQQEMQSEIMIYKYIFFSNKNKILLCKN